MSASKGIPHSNTVTWQLDAAALTNLVFPQPGGPQSSTPLLGLIPSLVKTLGQVTGSSTALLSRALMVSIPPREDKEVNSVQGRGPGQDQGGLLLILPPPHCFHLLPGVDNPGE